MRPLEVVPVARLATILDPVNAVTGNALIDGNPFAASRRNNIANASATVWYSVSERW